MPSTRALLVLATLLVLDTALHGQSGLPGTSRPAAPLPQMTDWFLSTGDWQNDPQLYVREFGRGSERVVMLHGGWGAEHSGLIEAVRPLEHRYRFVFYDQRGSLRSPAPDSSISFDRHVEDLELLRRELNLDTITIVGHSMGAVLASAYATKYPDRVRHLLLLAPAYLKNPLSKEEQRLLQQGNADFQTFLNRPEVAYELNQYGLDRTDRPLTSAEETARFRINLYRRMLYDVSHWPRLTGGRALYKAHVGELTEKTYPASGWNYIQEFSARQYPVSIIVGDHDFLDFGNGLLEQWGREAPRVNVSIIEKAGHLLWIDQPDVLAQAIARHLAGAKTPASR